MIRAHTKRTINSGRTRQGFRMKVMPSIAEVIPRSIRPSRLQRYLARDDERRVESTFAPSRSARKPFDFITMLAPSTRVDCGCSTTQAREKGARHDDYRRRLSPEL